MAAAAPDDLEKAVAPTTGQPPADDTNIPPEEEEFQPPDGGLLAWSQVLAGIFINMLAWGYPSTFGVYQLYYRDTLGLPEAQIAWIGSLQTFLAFALCAFSGRLADAGYVRSTIVVGSGLVVFGTFMTSICTEYWQIFLAQGLCTGIGLGVIFMPPLSVISSYFVTKRSSALAISATGTGFGSVIFPATIQYLIPRIGFPWAVRCAAFVALFVATVSVVMLKPKLRPRRSGPIIEWEAFKEGPYLLYMLGAFLFFWALYFGFFYINAYARNVIHFSTTDSVQLLLITNGMGIPGRPVTGYLADRYFGPINLYAFQTLVMGCLIFAWTGVTTRTGMYVFAVFFGLAIGAAQGLYAGSLASLTKDPRKMGTRFGMVCTLVAFASLAGPPTAGAIIDKSGGRYLYAQAWAGSVIVLAAMVFAACRWAVTGWKLRVKI
ncbi:major facilitator superfamily domain-containing protein [Chaetomium sp. MPI-SDFR-AT-0129]|uniref:Major facilitator superfamily domain-containing protein n=1 Tax=Dichotomopilus funicola TaxID=1934379 RepID=A0AAN6V259_9PEZI|nr:major facilitator superfamily domain-containing protein [Chaetomium sp. MPI-SDFR-AT-0129]KAK4142171.1 major facilitator superfamily domain-containing protein [Dichotomopilus funicola]